MLFVVCVILNTYFPIFIYKSIDLMNILKILFQHRSFKFKEFLSKKHLNLILLTLYNHWDVFDLPWSI